MYTSNGSLKDESIVIANNPQSNLKDNI